MGVVEGFNNGYFRYWSKVYLQFIFLSGEKQRLRDQSIIVDIKDNGISLRIVNVNMGPMLVCLSALTSANVDIDNSQTEVVSFKNET